VKVSVVVPFYSARRFVPAAIENLRHHIAPDVEFVLVDDASPDGTREALEEHAATLPGARVVARSTNGGLASARNSGVDESVGRYVTFLDADDWYGRGYLGELVATIERLPCDFVRVDHVQVRGRKRVIVRSPEGRRDEVFEPQASILPFDRSSGVDYPYAWAGIFDVERMGKQLLRFDDGLHTCEDRPWLWRLYLRASSHAVVGLHGLFYRREVAGSLTQVADRRQLHFIDAFDQIIADVTADADDARRYLVKAIRSYCAIIAHHLREDGRFAPALRRELHERSAAALHRLPSDVLSYVLAEMDRRRAAQLRSLMRRHPPSAAGAVTTGQPTVAGTRR